jgi:hypothetical protein
MSAIKIDVGVPLWLVHLNAYILYYYTSDTIVQKTVTLNCNVCAGALNNILHIGAL